MSKAYFLCLLWSWLAVSFPLALFNAFAKDPGPHIEAAMPLYFGHTGKPTPKERILIFIFTPISFLRSWFHLLVFNIIAAIAYYFIYL